MDFDGATVLLQWAVGGLAFCWVTTRHQLLGIGYGWLLRGVWGLTALGGLVVGLRTDTVPVREAAALGVVLATLGALVVSVRLKDKGPKGLPRWLDLPAPLIGIIGLVAAGVGAGGPGALAAARVGLGAAVLGALSHANRLRTWYLVQPGLTRDPLYELLTMSTVLWFPEVLVLLWPVGMVSVINGTIDDGYGGMLGWFWVMSAATTIVLLVVTRLALREKQYSAVMAGTGLLYLAILTAAGTDLVARALLAS